MAWLKSPTFRIKITTPAGKVSYLRGDPFDGKTIGPIHWVEDAGEWNTRESAQQVADEWVISNPEFVATVEEAV